jgi:dTDP-4-amino-4,6-dideoxygalactose transaminase
MLSMLPPVGNRICLRPWRDTAGDIEELFSPYRMRLYQSGTAALAAALAAAVARHARSGPEVLLPAYACPDLVSAVLYAGARPVLVDLCADTPWLDLSELEAKITRRSVAIIAVNFLGIAERLASLRAIADKSGLLLIEDNAQCLFDPTKQEGPRGDFIIQSFARGKPVSLLQGGAVIYRDVLLAQALPPLEQARTMCVMGRLAGVVKMLLYNALLTPQAYGLINTLPFLHIGETRFKRLPAIHSAGALVRSLLPANVAACRMRPTVTQDRIKSMLKAAGMACVLDLASALNSASQQRLLRYPLLIADSQLRDALHARMKKAGLGVSRMYPAALPGIAGLEQVVAPGERFPNAERFARSILTLPTHDRVETRHIRAMATIIVQSCAGGCQAPGPVRPAGGA